MQLRRALWGQAPLPGPYLVFQLPGWLQILHGQQVVHEVHVRGHLQEGAQGLTPGKPGSSFCRSSMTSVLTWKQDDGEVWLQFPHNLEPQTEDTAKFAQFSLSFYLPPTCVFLSKAPEQAEVCGARCVESGSLPFHYLWLGITILH